MRNLGLMDPAFLGGLQSLEVDPYFSSVSLLLHGNGTNGSTSIIDSSPSPKTVTAVGNAQIGTAQSRFGGSSIYFDGSGDALSITPLSSFNFGAANFTIEFSIYPIAWTAFPAFILFASGAINIDVVSTTLRFTIVNGPGLTAAAPSLNQWSHVASVRNGNNFSLFINESFVAGDTSTVNLAQPSSLTLNRSGFESQIYLDEVRITNNIARYATGTGANAGKMVHAGTNILALPTAPFPDA
jgi:hypothetical protein